MFFPSGNSLVTTSRISFTVLVPSHCFQMVDPSLSRLALKVLSRFSTLQKDLPKLLVNFGTVITTRPSLVVDHSKSNRFGLYKRNSSAVGSPLLFVFRVNFPQWDVCKECCDEDPDKHRW